LIDEEKQEVFAHCRGTVKIFRKEVSTFPKANRIDSIIIYKEALVGLANDFPTLTGSTSVLHYIP
jgi:hypothetical protein